MRHEFGARQWQKRGDLDAFQGFASPVAFLLDNEAMKRDAPSSDDRRANDTEGRVILSRRRLMHWLRTLQESQERIGVKEVRLVLTDINRVLGSDSSDQSS
jgi:hypothetical protein